MCVIIWQSIVKGVNICKGRMMLYQGVFCVMASEGSGTGHDVDVFDSSSFLIQPHKVLNLTDLRQKPEIKLRQNQQINKETVLSQSL